jgi:hypothetical protein
MQNIRFKKQITCLKPHKFRMMDRYFHLHTRFMTLDPGGVSLAFTSRLANFSSSISLAEQISVRDARTVT